MAGGRWTLPGVYALYTAVHRSLAYLEYLVHLIVRDTWPVNVKIASIHVEDHNHIIVPTVEELPEKWSKLTYHIEVQMVVMKSFKQGLLGALFLQLFYWVSKT
ncbi:MAG: hypothetical protein O2887_14405 [Bacteroidetes bacterium]|nr:hypothetical protein [Bacteroidota bacterium]